MKSFFGEDFFVRTEISNFLNTFVHLIANAQIQDFTRDKKKQNKTKQKKPGEIIYKLYSLPKENSRHPN